MACTLYTDLITTWKQIISQPYEDDHAVTAYWDFVDHKLSCEVCKDEQLIDAFSRKKRLIF